MPARPSPLQFVVAALIAAVLIGSPPPAAQAAEGEVGTTDVNPEVSDEYLHDTLLLLQRRRIALQVHQVLADTAFIAILTSASLSTAGTILRAAKVPEADLFPLDVAETVASVVSIASYSPAGIIAWATPSPTGYITGKGIKPPGSGRDRHILLSILHGLLYGAYYSTGIALAVGVPAHVRQGLAIGHAACGFGAVIAIRIAHDAVDRS